MKSTKEEQVKQITEQLKSINITNSDTELYIEFTNGTLHDIQSLYQNIPLIKILAFDKVTYHSSFKTVQTQTQCNCSM